MFNPTRRADRRAFLTIATYFEGSLVLVAYLIGWLSGVAPLASLNFNINSLAWGLAGTFPLCLVFMLAYRFPWANLKTIKSLLIERLGPLLDVCHWTGLAYLALLAGTTEEILFRGLLQPLLESHWGWMVGLLVSNLLFALAHSITPLYALLAGLTGVYLGLSLDFSSERNLLTPITIHALYDFLAFLAVARIYRHGLGRTF
jgi:hypothetical protein